MLLGLRTVIYPAPNLPESKAWFTHLLGKEPYFDQPFYVGYSVAGYELGLDPHADPAKGPVTYWGVANAEEALQQLVALGAEAEGPVQDVGDGIRSATVRLPGNQSIFGIIENPHFHLEPVASAGPGR